MLDLCIVAICKNEHDYLAEWITYHYIVGIQHFFIYDNESSPPLSSVLHKFQDIVTVIEWPGHKRDSIQHNMMNTAIVALREISRWVAFIDIDEFILPKKHNTILEFLEENDGPNIAGFKFYWQIFGSNGCLTKPFGLQIENFTIKAPVEFSPSKHTKCIVHPNKVNAHDSPHNFVTIKPYIMCDEYRRHHENIFSDTLPISIDFVQINHYFTRSKQEFADKVARSQNAANIRKLEDFDIYDSACTIKDTLIIDKFGEALKGRLNEQTR